MFSQDTQKWLIDNEYDINDINKVGKYGNSALMKAVREAKPKVAQELIKQNADLEIKNIDGNTALWNACFGGDYKCV
jgi:ankyrin repeat protein